MIMARVVDLGALVHYKHRTGLGNIQMGTEMSGKDSLYVEFCNFNYMHAKSKTY